MSLKITPQVFKWLQSISLVKQAKRNNDLLQLSQQISQKFFDGNHIGLILKTHLTNLLDQESTKKIQTLKQNSNPAIRLYNWNILTEILKKNKIISLELTEKSKIVNLEYEPILRVLRALYESRSKPVNSQKKGLKVQISELQKKSILQTNNSMEFLILTLSKNFKLSPQHTLNLFIDNNKYLSHLLVKGVKNNFNLIHDFLREIKINLDYLVSHIFCVDEEQNVTFFFNALKSCLISKDQQTVWECLDLWMDIHMTYKIKMINTKHVKKWIKTQGVNTLFFTLSKNSQFFQKIIELCHNHLDSQLFELFQSSQKSLLWNNEKQKLNFFRKIITLENKQIVIKLVESTYIDEWLRYFIKNNKKLKQFDELYDMNLIFQNLWLLMEDKFEDQKPNLINSYLQFLKQILTIQNSVCFITASISLFNLIKVLGHKKNSYAPLLYKMAVTVFGNLPSTDQLKVTFFCQNLIFIIKQIKNLPGGSLVATIIKHLSTFANPYLLQLCRILFQQKRVNEQESIQILQILTKIIFQDALFSEMAIQIVFEYIPSLNDEIADQYLLSNSKLSLSNFVAQAKHITKTFRQLKFDVENEIKNNSFHQNIKGKDKLVNQFKKLQICKNSVNFLKKYLQIDDINLKNSLQVIIFHTYVKVKIELRNKKVADLLLPLMRMYYEMDQQLQNQISEYQKQSYPEQEPQSSKIGSLKNIKLGKSLDLSSLNGSYQFKTIEPSSLRPSNFALKDLEALKQKRQHLKTIQVLKQKQSVQTQTKLKETKKVMNQKRQIQFGSAKPNSDYKNLYEFDTVSEEQIVCGVPVIRLVNFDKQQESTYQDDLRSILRKFRKVWRFLFFKYSTLGARKQQSKTQQKIHVSEIWKMLRQYEVFTFLKKQQSQSIVKLVNDMMKRKNDPQSLTYPGFEQFIAQVCCYAYSKSQYPHVPSGRQVVLFIQQLKRATKSKGASIELFQNPEDIYFQQTDVIRQYNKRLKQNPDYILPEGYKKYKQRNLEFEYNIHPMIQKNVRSSYIDVYEVLHQILFARLQISLVQPISLSNQITLAKPMLFQNITQRMKEYKKGYLQPKSTTQIKQEKQKQLKKSVVLKKQFRPHINFSLGIKLGLSSVSVKNKSIAQEVAYWMHDMLSAVQNQSLKVQNMANKKIQNPVIIRKRAQSLQKLKKQRSHRKQWKKRAQSIKVRLQVQKKSKQQVISKKKQTQIQQRKRNRARQQQALRNKLTRFQQMKKIMSQRREEIKYKKIEEQDVRKQRLESYKQKVAQYFQKKKQQILQKQQEMRKKKQVQQKQKQVKQEKQSKFVKQLYLSSLKKQQNVVQRAQYLKEQYQQLWQSQEIQKQLKKYEKQLTYLFNLLLKYQKSKISATMFDEIGLNTLHYFALKFMVVPFMVEKTQLIKIFNYIIKQKQKKLLTDDNQRQKPETPISSGRVKSPGLKFKDFQQSLLLIVIKAKVLLNKIKEKRKKKLQKLIQFIKEKKNQDGNHFEVQNISDSEEQEQKQESDQQDEQKQKAPGLLQNYLFNVENVDQETLRQVFIFLKLPKDKFGVQKRYCQAVQSRNLKPKNILSIQLKKQMQSVSLTDIPQKGYLQKSQEEKQN